MGRKKACRCGGVFSSWCSALTVSCCLVLLYSLLPCQRDYYRGLAVGNKGTQTILVQHFAFVTLSYMHKHTHREGQRWPIFPVTHTALLEEYDHLSDLAKRLNKSSFSVFLSVSLCVSVYCTCVCVRASIVIEVSSHISNL